MLHSQNEKKLDFGGDFLSVIRGLVGMFPKHPKNLFFFFFEQQNAPLAQKSYQFQLIHAILTKFCDKISCFYRAYLAI
ncbi:hypothetical protein BTM398_11650 [Helicobacter pylori]